MIETAIQICLVLLAGAFAVGTTLLIAGDKKRIKREHEIGKVDKQGTVEYTKGDNT